MRELTEREQEMIYDALSDLLDDRALPQEEFNKISTLRDTFHELKGE